MSLTYNPGASIVANTTWDIAFLVRYIDPITFDTLLINNSQNVMYRLRYP